MRLLADENFNGRILRALQRRIPGLDVLRVQETQLSGAGDRELLAWAAEEGRILLTHDVATLVGLAYERVRSGRRMPGVVAVRTDCPLGEAIDDLQLLVLTGEPEDLESRIRFLPL